MWRKFPKKKRQTKIEELRREYEQVSTGTNQNYKPFSNTIIRQPTDYETHPSYKKSEPVIHKFSEDYRNLQEMTLEEYEEKTNLKKRKKETHTNGSEKSTVEDTIIELEDTNGSLSLLIQ